MNQYILTAQNQEKAETLIAFLETLDYIEVKPVDPDNRNEAIQRTRELLKEMPDQPHRMADVVRAVRSLSERKKAISKRMRDLLPPPHSFYSFYIRNLQENFD